MPLIRRLLLTTTLLCASAGHLAAQQMLTPEPIAESAPTAQRARAVAELVLAGDQGKLAAFLKDNATDEFRNGPTFATDVAAIVELAKTGARTIVRMDGLGAIGVGVALAREAGAAPERALVVGLEREAPHRVTSLRMASITGPGGGGQ